MTTHDSYPASTDDGPAAPLTESAPRTERDEPSPDSREAGESAWSETVLRGQSQPDDVHDAAREGVGDGDGDGDGGGVAEGAALITVESSADYRARWKVVQGDFIDEPRKAVTDADSMVGEILDELAETFRRQRQSLEQDWADDKSTTEDLRIALRRYRTFFDRLLTL
jgi:hypothetical protein